MSATERLRAMLDERGIEWRRTPHYSGESLDNETIFSVNGFEWYACERDGYLELRSCKLLVTPEQAIAATVGNGTDLASRLREVHGLHAFAELFGFDWTDESDWSWHDVACAMADAIDATAGVGTCHMEVHDNLAETGGMGDVWLECDACHWQMPLEPTTPRFKHCPNCGKRTAEEEPE